MLLVSACGSDRSSEADSTTTDSELSAGLNPLISPDGTELVRAYPGGSARSNPGIFVSGRGEVSGAPDLAIINLGVEPLADTAAGARAAAAAAINGAIAVLRVSGVAEDDIQTRFFNISPRYTSMEVTRCVGSDGEEAQVEAASSSSEPSMLQRNERAPGSECLVVFERVLVGYQVNNQLAVKVRDLDSVSEIIDGVAEAAGDLARVDGIDFSIEDSKTIQGEARAAAIENLQYKAGQLAALAGVELGALVSISESDGASPAPFARTESDFAFYTSSAASTPIQVGELDVVVTVQAVYEIGESLP